LNCAPVAQIVGMPDNIMRCATDTTAITLAAYGAGVSGMNFQWMKNGSPLENETGGSFTVNTITQNSLFTVVVTNPENGCSATSNAISVLALPNAYSQVDTTLAPGTVLHGVAIAHDTTFITELPASNGCDSTIFYTVHLLSGSSQLQQDQFQFRASPNPAQSVVILDLSLPTAAPEATICLFNQVGKMVQKTVYNDLPVGKNQRQLTLNGLPPGIYAIRVQIGWQTSTRIVVHS
jgi:hypothetical protein